MLKTYTGDCFYDEQLVVNGQVVEKRHTQQTITDSFSYGELTLPVAKCPPHPRQVERHIVENAQDILLLQVRNERISLLQ